jgi:enoyl-[acyl-carrier protein] reductase I
MGFLKNKRALITGVISNRSIAYGIAEAFQREGAELAFTYQTDKVKERVVDLASEFNSKLVYPCDVSCDEDITNLFKELNKSWDGLDILVHSIAYAPADQLKGDYVECINREGFQIAHDVSSYSLGALAKAAMPMMKDRKGSIVTLSYLGSERAFPSYNVMGIAKASLEANVRYLAYSLGPKGIRVNAISAGPIKTLAAAGIQDFRKIQNAYESIVPMRENITTEQVGNTAAFLCSDLASGITGEVVHVDNGFHIVGLMGEGF